MKKVAIGSIVHFVMPNGEHRPAIVVKVWDEEEAVNAVAFLDGSNDQPGTPVGEPGQLVKWVTSVHCSNTTAIWTWHWPEEE